MTVKRKPAAPAVKADALQRALRTWAQGAVAAAGVGVTTAVGAWVTGGSWDIHTLEVSAATAAATGVLSYLHRRFVGLGGNP